uniref:Uncharacterized protein n=1 Tax=Nelumbo nucifera TaxID=4432 RepID=A0A822Y7Q3_NELNU|nr:TPA_asm: hypothetical protein HUJ06_028714 [Nelumbo nucifera]
MRPILDEATKFQQKITKWWNLHQLTD